MTDDTISDNGVESAKRNVKFTYEIDDDESPSEAVVRAVSSFMNTSVLDLGPLYEVIDPNHLNGVFETPEAEGGIEECSITLRYNGCQAIVTQERVYVGECGGNTS